MSIFDLASSPSELPSFNQNMARMIYEQYPPLRSVQGSNFSNGVIDIRWEVSGTRWWIPSRSYLRIRARITKGDGTTPISLSDEIGPNMGLGANLFTSCEIQIAGKTVSRVSELMAQVDAMDKRLSKSKSWMDSAGKLNWWQADQQDRRNHVSVDGRTKVRDNDVAPRILTRVEAGFDAATNTVAVVAATSVMNFLVQGGIAINIIEGPGKLYVGDVIVFSSTPVRYEITRLVTGLQAEVTALNLATIVDDGAAANEAFTIERFQAKGEHRGAFETIWQPPLGIFKLPHALPAGQYRMLLNPKPASEFEISAIESLVTQGATKSSPADFRFIVDDLQFYISTVESARVDDKTYFMSLDEIRCQTDNVSTGDGLQQRFFDVSPSTYALSLAFQDQGVTTDTRRSASKFKIRETVTGAKDTDTTGGADLYLSRMFLNYGGVNKPQPDADPSYVAPQNRMSQLYATSNFYSGMYFDSGGPETEEEYRERGPYYYYAWPRDGTSESTRVTCNFQFTPKPVADQGRVLLFDLSHKVVMVTVKDGRVTDVLEQDA